MHFLRNKYLLAALLVCFSNGLMALSLSGRVEDDKGEALAGALVTVKAEDGLYSETVYSNVSGEFGLETKLTGTLSLRIRKPGYSDALQSIKSTKRLVIKLTALRSAEDLSGQLTNSAYIASLKFKNLQERKSFHVDCLSCHQLGNPFTRAPRTREQWTAILIRMLGFWGVNDEQLIARYVDILSEGFKGQLLTSNQNRDMPLRALKGKVYEWKLPAGLISHDVEYHEDTGKLYTVDQGSDRIYITDPVSNSTESVDMPEADVPVGGKFFQLYDMRTPYGLAVRYGPHSLQQGPDKHFYITNTISGGIGEFDPVSRIFIDHAIGGKAMYPHTLRFEKAGRVWFTLSASNQLGRFNTSTHEMTLIDLPDTTTRPAMTARMPYGIDINPQDGSVWYGRLHANLIGRVDPETLKNTEFDPGINGPRRMRFSKDGILWIPAFGDGQLVRLDPVTMEYTRYTIPPLAEGEIEAPYAVGIHPRTQEVWVTTTTSDRLFRFLPKDEKFIHYPLPTAGTYLRDVIFLPNGHACAASSPVPVLPTVVEDGMQAIICVDAGEG
jgi:DNA-binding beta-propeller fold protein YncE